MPKYQNNQTIGIIKKSINDIIDEKNVNYKDIFSKQSEETRPNKDSFVGFEKSIFERNQSKSVAVLNNSSSKKVR